MRKGRVYHEETENDSDRNTDDLYAVSPFSVFGLCSGGIYVYGNLLCREPGNFYMS